MKGMKKNTKWKLVETYPCPSQCLAVKYTCGLDVSNTEDKSIKTEGFIFFGTLYITKVEVIPRMENENPKPNSN